MRCVDVQRATVDTEQVDADCLSVCYCRSPSISDLSGVAASSCETEVGSPESPGEEGWTKCPQRQARPLQQRRSSQKNKDMAFRSYEKYFEHKMYVFGHKYSSK